MIAARQELELRPALERLDRIIAASEGIEPDTLTFAFRPLWQLDAASAATIALTKAQATQVYAGLSLWPKATMARLVQAQLAEDGTYPNAQAVFAEGGAADPVVAGPTLDYDPDQPRDPDGRWTAGEGDDNEGASITQTHPPLAGSSVASRRPTTVLSPAITASAATATGPHAPDGSPITLVQQTCADFIAQNCKASILLVFPREYLDQPLSKVYEDAAGGSATARTAKKLLDQSRFRK